MRAGVQAFLLAGLGLSALLASSAFTYNDMPRPVTVTVAGDGAGYLRLAANPSSPHDCFVDETAGEVSITFDATDAGCGGNGGGTGVNPGDGSDAGRYARYAFHDVLVVKNQGIRTVRVWANATTASGGGSSVLVAKEADAGQMAEPDYAASSASSILLAPGEDLYLGVRVHTGTLASGSVQGVLRVDARKA